MNYDDKRDKAANVALTETGLEPGTQIGLTYLEAFEAGAEWNKSLDGGQLELLRRELVELQNYFVGQRDGWHKMHERSVWCINHIFENLPQDNSMRELQRKIDRVFSGIEKVDGVP